ncbi:hypothetical protein Pcinc_033842 [Petrolisthes cinctipes]|uniref:Uncharacterized protein n=2 Tax=Petrolisthes cinctipes TaxID=88211 RepID=A0AAE1ERG2_PETCI|nr:hypothetical protein Pcinc_033842 [Petrolisthes cinctipes]
MSGAGEREGSTSRSSRRPSPLRATLPVQAMHRTSPLRLRNRISPDTEIAPGLDLSTTASTSKGKHQHFLADIRKFNLVTGVRDGEHVVALAVKINQGIT